MMRLLIGHGMLPQLPSVSMAPLWLLQQQLLLLLLAVGHPPPVTWASQCDEGRSEKMVPSCRSDSWQFLECSIVTEINWDAVSFHINQFK